NPSSLTKAETSHEDIRIRAAPKRIVVIERPRVGGAAISCSQIASMQDSKSKITGTSVDTALLFSLFSAGGCVFPRNGAGSAALCKEGVFGEVAAGAGADVSAALAFNRSSARSTSVLKPSNLSNA